MELQKTAQIPAAELNNLHFDLFIAALGYEKRGAYLPEKFLIKANSRICIAYKEKSSLLNRRNNEKIFLENGFEILNVSGEEQLPFENILKKICSENRIVTRILIDYSCMTKVWYSGLLNMLSKISVKGKIEAYFSYTPASFNTFSKQKRAKLAYSVSSEDRKPLKSNRPLALIIGLGLNNLKAEMLIRSVKPSVTHLFYSDPAMNVKYVKKIFANNLSVMETVDIRNVHNYPISELEQTAGMLTKVCLELRLQYHVLIAPVGPKVFTLLTLILACRYPDIDVWRVTAGKNEPSIDRIPEGEPLVYRVDFENEE